MTTLILDKKDWKDVRTRITEEYGTTFFLIRSRVERELGFTSRNHREWFHESGWKEDMRLDFKDPARATFFQLKYL